MRIDRESAGLIAAAITDAMSERGMLEVLARLIADAMRSEKQSPLDTEPRLSPKEAAAICGCHEQTIRRAIHSGKLPATAVPGVGESQSRLLVSLSAVQMLRDRNPV